MMSGTSGGVPVEQWAPDPHHTLLQEVFTHDYNVTDQEVLEYCELVGIEVRKEPHLLPLARAALLHPLPPPWMPVEDNNLGLYFFNQVTGESRWTHPVDTVVRALVVSNRITTGSQDSFTEDFSTEEDLVISDLLRAQVSDLTHSDSDVNNLSNYIATALILAETCTKATEKLKKNPHNICITSVLSDLEFEEPAKKCENITCSNNITNCDRNVCDDNKKKINFGGHSDTDVTCSDDVNKTNVISDATKTKLDICDIVKVNNVNVNSASKGIEENPKKTNSIQQKGDLIVRDSPNLNLPVGYIECTQNSTMSGGGLGRGLGQLPLPPQPLGAPSSLAGPLSLSRPILSRPSPGGPLVPPVGGLLTPLAPIAAASRVGPTQLAPLKPLGATSHSLPPNREGVGNPLLRRQLAHKEQQAQSDGLQGHRTQSGERATNTKTQAQSARHQQDKDVIDGLGSPPKSILKDPVLARGGMDRVILEQEGVDRLLLMQSNETKNLRFDFKTDDLQFHSSEEECDKEEMEEEEEEEEVEEEEIYEYEDEEDEEFDSEAEDPEEEAILRAHGVIDDDSEGCDFMLNDANDLLPVQSKPHPQKLNTLPHGPDPWADSNSVKPTLKVMSDSHNPLQHFRKQKGENKLGVAERQLLDNINQKTIETPPKQNKTEQQKKQVPGKDSLGKPKSAGTEACNSSISSVQDSRTGKPKVPNAPSNLTRPTTISGKTMLDKTNDAQNSPAVKKSDDVKKTEAKPQEDRKLELEGAPRNRKTNPLDRVVAKLSGRTENKEEELSSTTVAAAAVPATVKNLTVNLNKLMNNEDESEEEKSGGVQLSGSVAVTSHDDIHQINLAAAKHLEAEKKKLQDKFEADIQALQHKLNKEYRDTEEKIMREHKARIEKFQEQEKKKLEQKRKEINSKLTQENNKDIEGIKIRIEKESNERKNQLIKEIEERNNEEIEKIKLEFAQDMQQKKETMQRDHEEEMHDLEKELQALYAKEQKAKQEEVDAARASAATRSSSNTAAAAATAELEKSLNELLQERQAEIKREHNKQLAILRDELDKILEKTAREAKEKETLEKKNHADSLAKMKESYEIEVRQLEEIHCENINKLEVQHEEDLSKLKSDFKAELTVQKTELENKLTEFKIEYDQRMNSLGQDELDEGDNDNDDDDNDDNDKHGEGMESNRKNSIHEETFIPDVNVRRENGKLNEEMKKYDHILRELRERRRSLEEDLEALKTQEKKVKELQTHKLTSDASSCCSKNMCIHQSKYNKMKEKYSNLVTRIKVEKSKKWSKKLATTHEEGSESTPSLSSEKSSIESNTNVSHTGQPSRDVTSSVSSSPKRTRKQHNFACKSSSDVSDDEEIKLANQVLEKYDRIPEYLFAKNINLNNVGSKLKHNITKPITSTPKKAWMDDELLTNGRKVLKKTEKFIKSNPMKTQREVSSLRAEDIKREILRQNADFKAPSSKVSSYHVSLAARVSETSDTESDEHTHEVPSLSSDFGLDQMLAKISCANKSSRGIQYCNLSSQEKVLPLRATASLEHGLNNITNPLNTFSSGYNTVSPAAQLRLEHLNTGSVPDLGPNAVDRIANINQYLQQRWTNYFGELSVPLGGQAGWPAQIIGQSTFLVNKNNTTDFLTNNKQSSMATGRSNSFVVDRGPLRSQSHKEDLNITQKIDNLRTWLESAQTTAVLLDKSN